MNNLNPAIISLARESRGLTQTDLSRLLNVSQGTISKIEQGLLDAKETVLDDIAGALGYPVTFFYESFPIYPPSFNHHRKRKAIPQKELNRINALVNICRSRVKKLLSSVEMDVKVPFYDVEEFGAPDEVARQVKIILGVPRGPVENMTLLLENAGVLIFRVNFGTSKIDGVSIVTDIDIPIVFINAGLAGDRMRFTLAHELAHLVMHHNTVPGPDMEAEADLFAAEFLMPKSDIEDNLYQLNLEKLAFLKRKWKVAMSALAVRASRLSTISEHQYRYLMIKMSERGYRLKEPVELDIPQEEPTLLKELFSFYFKELEYDISDLCKLLCLERNDLEDIYLEKTARLRLIK